MKEMLRNVVMAYLYKMAIEDLVGSMTNAVLEQGQRNLLKQIA